MFPSTRGNEISDSSDSIPYVSSIRFGDPSNQANTIELSLHANTESRGMSRACLVVVRMLARRDAPHSSSLGIDTVLIGATLVLDMTSLHVVGLL